MNSIAASYAVQMSRIAAWVDLINRVVNLGTEDINRLRSTVPVAVRARDVHQGITGLGSTATIIAYEGAFLTACAEFELTVREMVEKFVDQARTTKATFSDLPVAMQKRQHKGCAKIITYLDQERFNHLTIDQVIADLYSCHPTSPAAYKLLPEAFSENERNFNWSMTKEVMERLGISDFGDRIGNEGGLATLLSTTVGQNTMSRASGRLNEMMRRRNQIVHRGRSAYSPSESDVRECASFFATFAQSLANVLTAHLATL